MTDRPDSRPERASIRRDLIARLANWTFVGGCEGDLEWELVRSLSDLERKELESELERIQASVSQLLETLRSRDDDLYRR